MKGLFIPEITAEMFRNGCLESIEALMAEGEIYDIEYEPQKWIPCSERLPAPNEFVLVQNQNLQCFVFCMREEEVWYDYDFVYQNEGIIAWMPLPEAWRGEE